MLQLLAAAACFTAVASSTPNDAEVVLTRYRGIPLWELGSKASQQYRFTFCLCDSPVINPETSRDCQCSYEMPAKTGVESAVQVAYSSSCAHTYNPKKCLNARIIGKSMTNYAYVRVMLGGEPVTSPVWQNIRSSRYKSMEMLSTIYTGHIDMFYQILTIFNSVQNEKQYYKPKVTPYITRALTTTTPVATTTLRRIVYRPPPPPLFLPLNNFIQESEISRLTSMEAIRYYLLREGIRSGTHPMYFDQYEFKHRMVGHHNNARARHGCQPLVRDVVLDSAAQRWASVLAANQDCLHHERPKRFGENLFFFGANKLVSPDQFAEATTQMFYVEGVNYDYSRFNPTNYHIVGHFTQLIWRSTTRMGVGIAISYSDGRGNCGRHIGMPLVYVVVKYDPPGNLQSYGAYMDNVLPPYDRRRRA